MKATRKEYVKDRQVWLDAAKTRGELLPNRMFHRVSDYLQAADTAKQVEKNPKFRTVKVNGSVIGYPCGSTWKWTEAATQHYTGEQLAMAESYASQA